MKRSALPLPRYVLRKPIKSGGWAYYFNVPIWARKAVVRSGMSRSAPNTRRRCSERRPCCSRRSIHGARRRHGCSRDETAKPGTLDWIFAEYRADSRYTELDVRTKRNHEVGFRLVGGYTDEGRSTARNREPRRHHHGSDRRAL